MKIPFSPKKRRYLEIGFLLLFPLFMLVLPAWRHHIYYPTSDTFVNPWDGGPAPEFEEFLTPLIFKRDGGKEVLINLGDCPSDVIKMAALQYLSPIIRMNPQASVFRMSWNLHIVHYFASVELTYDREKGEVSTTEWETLPGKSSTTTVLGKYLTDLDIHEAARTTKDYDVWAREHWKK